MPSLPVPAPRRDPRARPRRFVGGALAAAVLACGWPAPTAGQAPDVPDNPRGAEDRHPRAPLAPFFGPLTTEEAGPLQRISFTHTVEGADLVPAGTFQAELWLGYSNIFEQDSAAGHELFLDMERLAKHVGVRWGVAERLEVGGRLSFESTGGGILDPFLTSWHGLLGVGNGNREKYPHRVFAQRLRAGDVEIPLDPHPRAMDLEEVRLFAKWRAWRSGDGRRLVSLRGVASLPARGGAEGGRGADLSFMALGRASWSRWHLHGTVGGATVRADPGWEGLVRPGAFFVDLAAERSLASWVSGVVQISTASPRLKGIGDPELDGWPVNLVFGVTGQVGDGWRVDVSFQEDIPPNTPAVDFTLGIGVRKSW